MTIHPGYIDVASDLTHDKFNGIYNGKQMHEPDLNKVILRARKQTVKKIVIPGLSRLHSEKALALAKTHERLYSTVGCAPANCGQFADQGKFDYFLKMRSLVEHNYQTKVVAVGPCGLDYAAVDLCDAWTQNKYFKLQLDMARMTRLPVLLRCRDAYDELVKVLRVFYNDVVGGAVIGFDGTATDSERLQNIGFKIAISQCSLRSQEVREEVIPNIQLQYLMLCTDSPDCPPRAACTLSKTTFETVKKNDWSPDKMVRGRTEPANIVQVFEAVAALRKEDPELIAYHCFRNANKLFFSKVPEVL